MARRRFFIDEVRNSRAVLAGEDARHLSRVLRAEVGQQFELSDNGSVYLAEIERVGKDEVHFRVVESLPAPPSGPPLCLLAAVIKFDHFEWMLEKATELGVETVVPVIAERSEKGLDRAAEKRLERWRRIVRESSQQCRRARMPEVLAPAPFREAIANPGPYAYFMEEEAGAPPILSVLPDAAGRLETATVSALIGPEGGWTDRERALATDCGWRAVSLGPLILRAETAALAALTILGNKWRTQ